MPTLLNAIRTHMLTVEREDLLEGMVDDFDKHGKAPSDVDIEQLMRLDELILDSKRKSKGNDR